MYSYDALTRPHKGANCCTNFGRIGGNNRNRHTNNPKLHGHKKSKVAIFLARSMACSRTCHGSPMYRLTVCTKCTMPARELQRKSSETSVHHHGQGALRSGEHPTSITDDLAQLPRSCNNTAALSAQLAKLRCADLPAARGSRQGK